MIGNAGIGRNIRRTPGFGHCSSRLTTGVPVGTEADGKIKMRKGLPWVLDTRVAGGEAEAERMKEVTSSGKVKKQWQQLINSKVSGVCP